MVQSNNAIYNTVGASISGVTNTLTVTNPSNTASSAARETIVVGGGSAGDPTINWNVSGATNWEMGIDNSVSDNLTMSQSTALGTKDVWRMDTTGRRTLPLQPIFEAFLSATQANVTGDGTLVTVAFDSAITNVGNNYNTGTGVFTAPITGNYIFFASIASQGSGVAFNDSGCYLTATGTALGMIGTSQALSGVANHTSGVMVMQCHGIINMVAGDTIKFQFNVNDGTKTVSLFGGTALTGVKWSKFSGALLC